MALWLFVRKAADEVPIKLEYTERIRRALADADIEIPFPHLQLFIDGAKGLESALAQIRGSDLDDEPPETSDDEPSSGVGEVVGVT